MRCVNRSRHATVHVLNHTVGDPDPMRALSLSALALAAALAQPAGPGGAGVRAAAEAARRSRRCHGGARWAGGPYRPGYGRATWLRWLALWLSRLRLRAMVTDSAWGSGWATALAGRDAGRPGTGVRQRSSTAPRRTTPTALGRPATLPWCWTKASSYVQQPQAEVVAPQPSRRTASYWYYCTEPAGYYPYVQQCARPWIAVQPQRRATGRQCPVGAPRAIARRPEALDAETDGRSPPHWPSLLALAGCVSVPQGPTVAVMPGAGKSLEQFRADAGICQQFAQSAIAGPSQAAQDYAASQRRGRCGSGRRGRRDARRRHRTGRRRCGLGRRHRADVRRRRGRQRGRRVVVHAAASVRHRLHAVHVHAGQSGAGAGRSAQRSRRELPAAGLRAAAGALRRAAERRGATARHAAAAGLRGSRRAAAAAELSRRSEAPRGSAAGPRSAPAMRCSSATERPAGAMRRSPRGAAAGAPARCPARRHIPSPKPVHTCERRNRRQPWIT